MSNEKLLNTFSRWSNMLLCERLDTLYDLIDYWFESRLSEQTKQDLSLPAFLPVSLKWLYEVIAKYNSNAFEESYGNWTSGDPVVLFYSLKKPVSLILENGYCEFLNENQGVYQCAINNNSDDPSVFKLEGHKQEWIKVTEKLSDFLLFLIIFEITLGSPSSYILGSLEVHIGSGFFDGVIFYDFVKKFNKVQTELIKCIWVVDNSVSIYLGHDLVLLTVDNNDGKVFVQAAAKNLDAVLKAKELGEWEYAFD